MNHLICRCIGILVFLMPATCWAQVNAAFSYNPNPVCFFDIINFTDLSTGPVVSWAWSYGNAQGSNAQNPMFQYVIPGTYTVTLTVYDALGGSSTASQQIVIEGPFPEFTQVSLDCASPALDFIDQTPSTYPVSTWLWDFGDGGTSTLQNPQHVYAVDGAYQVSLTVTGVNGCTNSIQPTINVASDIPTLQFSTTPNTNCQPPFTGTATAAGAGGAPPYTYAWDIPGGNLNQEFAFYLQGGFYSMTVIDANGCSFTDSVEVMNQGIGPQVTGVVTNVDCLNPNAGAIDLTITGTAPFDIQWSTGDTTEDISGVPAGAYTVSVTDSEVNCIGTSTSTFIVEAETPDPVFTVTDAACDGTGGAIEANITGGVPPYTFLWSTGDTTAMITGVSPGGYSLDVTDSTGCQDHAVAFVEYADTCLMHISGIAYLDWDGDCVRDTGEQGTNSWITLNGSIAGSTNNQGEYDLYVPVDTYTVSAIPLLITDTLSCPVSGSYTLLPGSLTSDIDFGIMRDTLPDVRVHMTKSIVRPGFTHQYTIAIHNEGGTMVSPIVSLKHDSLVSIQGTSPQASYDPLSRTFTWNLPALGLDNSTYLYATGYLPPSTSLGTSVSTAISVDPISGDATPANNTDTCQVLVVGSFDPNDKQVSPAGEGPEGNILATQQELKYTVRFQNTGTDTAFFVTVRDTLDQDLDITTFQPGLSSHLYSLTVEEDSILVFFFDNILLVDSFRNEPESNGYLSFLIRHEGILPLGREITNRAAIFFDFNEPVITNTVINTIYAPVGITQLLPEDAILAYPNPTRDVLYLEYGGLSLSSWELLDIQGKTQLIGENPPAEITGISLDQLPAGIYLLRVWVGEKMWIRRIFKQ